MKLRLWNYYLCASSHMALLLLHDSVDVVHGQQACDAHTGKCDTHERCPVWADEGECEIQDSASYMLKHCPGSCAERKQAKKSNCEDKLPDRCPVWADLGECDTNPVKMHEYCRHSCGVCDEIIVPCADQHEKCPGWAELGECDNNPKYMQEYCPKSCNACEKVVEKIKAMKEIADEDEDGIKALLQKTKSFGDEQRAEGERAAQTLARIKSSIAYMESEEVQALPKKVRAACANKHELCTFWQVLGECDNNKSYMTVNCAPACHTCHMIDYDSRCPPLPEGTLPALEAGDLDAMFTRIVSTAPGNQTETSVNPEMPPYTVHVHSSPDDNGRPWVITFENFLTEEETDALIQHGYTEGYKRSEDVGQKKADGTYDSVQSTGRTSENAWCSAHKGCRHKEVPNRILDRISAVTGIPPDNSEDFQILRYEPGQFYNTHHDYIEHQEKRNCGPRILTFFLYLSDVEEGGGTDFPDLGITVMPKRGRALLWPSVLNDKPLKKDFRTKHQALPVDKGVKFAANSWIHMYDYVTPQRDGCN